MKPFVFHIFSFNGRQFVEVAASFDAGVARCIQLYEASGRRKSFFVKAVEQ